MQPLIIIDFDDTLFDKARWYDEALSRSLESFGVSAEDFKNAYPKGGEGTAGLIGWSSEVEVKYLEKFLRHDWHCHALARDSAVAAINACVDACAPYLFPDAKDVLKRLCERFQVVLLSRGDQDFQRHKIRVTGVDRLVDEVVITPDHKADAIRSIMKSEDGQTYFVDDNVDSSIELKQMIPSLEVVLKRRRDVPVETYRLLDVPSFDTLSEIASYVIASPASWCGVNSTKQSRRS